MNEKHEEALDILFGAQTDAKAGLEELKDDIEREKMLDALKDTIVANQDTDTADGISSHNMITKEQPITNNSSRVEIDAKPITKLSNPHEDGISSHNSDEI